MSKTTTTTTKTTKAAKKTKRTALDSKATNAILAHLAKGEKIPAIAKATKNSVHIVAPVVWAAEAKALGSLASTPAAILAARKAGQRREVVAFRAAISVAKVREIETAKNRKPIYTGRGTKKHLTVA